jgi:predicted Zn-dependent peptidase
MESSKRRFAVAQLFSRLGLQSLALSLALLASVSVALPQTPVPGTRPNPPSARVNTAPVVDDSARLVTEFEVNGLKVLLKRREGNQTVVAGLFIRGGSRNINANNAGVEALMLDVATEASANFPRERFRRELSRTGTSISYGINYDYSALTLASTRQHFERSWEIFADAALRPSFAADDFERVKQRQLIALSDDEDTPDSYLQLLLARAAYTGHPYLNDPRGTAKSVAAVTVDDLKRYHQQMMQTSRLLLVIVGDLEVSQMRRMIETSFGKLPRGDYKDVPVPPLSFSATTVAVTPREIPTNYVTGVFAAPPLTSPDIYPLRVAASILQNRVFVEVRSKRNLSYAPDAFLGSQAANTGGIYVTAVDANQAVRLMLDEMTRLQREEVTAEELLGTTQQFLTRYYLAQETNGAQAGDLAQAELIGGGWRNSVQFIERLRAVTAADVKRVSQLYMKNLRFVVLGDPKSIDPAVFTGRPDVSFEFRVPRSDLDPVRPSSFATRIQNLEH